MRKTQCALLIALIALLLVGAVGITGCTDQTPAPEATPTPVETTGPVQELHIATTTSLYDTGLLDYLKPKFEEQYNAEVKIISAGTGKALGYGEAGDVDVMMVHDRAREDLFIDNEFGVNRRVIAYNFFVIVGPESDPAAIMGMSPEDAVKTIMAKGQTDTTVKFVSRGDDSGTHSKEKAIWKSAGYEYEEVQSSGDWYIEAGAGMGATLTLANEKEAYTVSDIGTFLAYQGDISLVTLIDQGDILLNIYSAMQINPAKFPEVNSTLAKEWINFMISEDIQGEIGNFRVAEFGRPLFFPSRDAWETIGVTREECEDPIP
jgi:tungstate transport system substrate-binding protein